MLDRIENARRLREQCLARARRLYAKGNYIAGEEMDRQAHRLACEIDNLTAARALTAFAARVEG